MITSVPTFNFLALLISEIKRVSQNLMWGLLAPCHTPYVETLCVLKVLGKVKQRAKFQHRISMHHAAMRMCIFHRLSIICAQKWFFWGFWGWRCEFLHLLYHRSGHIILLWGREVRRISPSNHISVHLIESAQFLDFFLLTLLAIIVFSSCIYCIRPIQCQLSLH